MEEAENEKFVDDVMSSLQSFHITSPNNGNRGNVNHGNVFQRRSQRAVHEATGVVSSEYSSDDSQSSNERRPRSLKQRIQRKLGQKSENENYQNRPKSPQIPDIIPQNDANIKREAAIESNQTLKPNTTPTIPQHSSSSQSKDAIPTKPSLNDTSTAEEHLTPGTDVKSPEQSTPEHVSPGTDGKPAERRRRRFITREKENEDTSITPDLTQLPTDTPVRTRTRRSLLNQRSDDSVSQEGFTSRTRSRHSELNQSAQSVLRAKSVERTVRVRSAHLSNTSSPSPDSKVEQPVNEQGAKSSMGRSAADCIRLRRAQSLERVKRPTIANNSSVNNKSCDDKQLSVPSTQVTQTPVIGSPLIAKLESTYKLLRSRSVRLSSDTSSKSEESNQSAGQTKNGTSQKNITTNDSETDDIPSKEQNSVHETKDVTLIFKSDENMDRQTLNPEIHQVETKTSKLDPSIYPHHDISNNTVSEQNKSPYSNNTVSEQNKSPYSNHQRSNQNPASITQQERSQETEQNTSNITPQDNSEQITPNTQRTQDNSEQITPNTQRTHHSHSTRSYSEHEYSNGKQETKGSKSLDIPDSSSALKRTPLVTDLDKAMMQRDEEKLRKLFRNTEAGINDVEKQKAKSPDIVDCNQGDMETDLDQIPCPLTKTSDNFQNRRSPATNSVVQTLTNPKPLSDHAKIFSSQLKKQDALKLDQSKSQKSLPEQKSKESEDCRTEDPESKEYSPFVNLDDAVKWPAAVPGKLDFSHMEVFEGKMLLQWLSSSIDDNHYLRLMLTRHDLQVIGSQYCTCLIAAGVIKEVNRKDSQWLFKSDCMYYWTHTELPKTKQTEIGKLTPSWPPPQQLSEEDLQAGRKFTEAEQQAMLVHVRNEYKSEIEKVQVDHQSMLDKCREEYQNRLQNCVEKIAYLEQEVARYKELAGIEKHSQTALSEAQAAEKEYGHVPNGYHDNQGPLCVAVTGTPQSQHGMPVATPECVSGQVPLQDDEDDVGMSVHKLKFSPEQIGVPTIPPPPPPPPPDIPPPPPPPPPVPGAPPPPPGLPGAPPPPPGAPPAPGLMQHARRGSLKPVISTKSPMKPLFWQRIVVNEMKSPKHKEFMNARLVWEEIDEARINYDEVDELFSKVPVDISRKSRLTKSKSPPKQFAKVIEPKRSQAIGILLSSLRLEFFVIENAIMNLDTSQVEMEKLKAIYDNRADDEEIKKIKKHLSANPGVPLDKPDQFLYDLTVIPDFAERMFCFIFQEAFQESISVIENRLNNLKMTIEMLMNGKGVKEVLGLVLAVGNYMNGGNRSRGQADGFDITILPRLKDVKTKDNRSSLLQFVVSSYIKKFDYENAGTEKAMLPLPDPSDISQGMLVNFDDITKEMKRIKKDFEAAHKRSEKVIKNSHQDDLYPFKAVMEDFFSKGKHDLQEQDDSIKESNVLFDEIIIYFCVKPKSGEKIVTPEYFFSLWSSFCEDFKQLWKKEQQKVLKIKTQEAEKRLKQLQESKRAALLNTRTRKAGSLKDKLASKGML